MSLLTTINHNEYAGNGGTDNYPYTFKIINESQLVVIRTNLSGVPTLLTLNVDYSVRGEGDAAGGFIVLLAGFLTTGFGLSISRTTPLTQTIELRTQGQYRPESLEDALDLIAMMIQDQGSPPSGFLLGLTTYTTATKPAASVTYNDKFIILKDPGGPAYLQICLQNADLSYAWATVATGNP